MKSVYFNALEGMSYVPFLYPNVGVPERKSIMFLNNAFAELNETFVQIADSPEEADYILLPHNYPQLNKEKAYIDAQAALAARLGKKLIVFWHGDSDAAVPYDNAIVFRTNQYRPHLRSNEIMMPAYAEDLLDGGLTLREKHTGKPLIGFCGWADYKNTKNRIGTLIKNSLIEAGSLIGMRRDYKIKGITYRMKAIDHLCESDGIASNFIIRSSYSGHSETIKIDPKQARSEYISNLLESDYALVIKGDGNYSYRFYEALSLGRIPVLLDTECVLPLEDVIDYDSFIVRVPYYDLYRIDHIVAEHYASISNADFTKMQQKAREAYEKYLKVGSFFEYICQNVL